MTAKFQTPPTDSISLDWFGTLINLSDLAMSYPIVTLFCLTAAWMLCSGWVAKKVFA